MEPGYWAVIPAQVRYAADIPAGAKLLYGEISSLTDARGYCFASNKYFAELYGVGIRTVQRYLDALKNAGLIRITDGEGGTDQRKIFAGVNPLSDPHDKIVTGGDKIDTAPVTELSPPYNELNKKEEQIPPKPPRGRAAKKAPDHLPDEFARLWTAYPRGEDKQGAIAEWDKLKPDEDTVFVMKLALLAQKQTEDWQRGIGIPYFVRWLRYRRWEDEKLRSAPPAAETVVETPPGVAAW